MIAAAAAKREKKGCDWIVANDVSAGSGAFGGDENTVHIVDGTGAESWPRLSKKVVAERLARRVAAYLADAP
jgi:phosphopantothenoylcysteine decarboxylase/phosphopantothenate--cysteine ligase